MTNGTSSKTRLGDITSHISSGSTPRGGQSVYLNDGPVMLVRSQNVRMNELDLSDVAFISEAINSEMKRSVVKTDDVLLNITGASIGRVARFSLHDARANVNQHVCIIRPVKGCLDSRFLTYYLSSPQVQHDINSRHQHGGTRQALTFAQIAEFEIPLPSLPEQKRIADILDKADAIRRKWQEALHLTSEMPLSAFRETFWDYLFPIAAHSLLSDVAEVVSGVAKGRKLNGAETREVPYLRVANVQAGYLDLSEIKTIPAKESEIQALALQHGDVVMTEGGDYDKLGRGALWEHDVPNCIHQNHVFRVRTDSQKLLPTFLVQYLQTDLAKRYFVRCAKKTTNLASINMTQLRGLPIPQPPLRLQERFDDELRTIRDVIDRQDTAQRDADCLFHSLVQRAFKGEL